MLQTAGHIPASRLLMQRQLAMFGRVLRAASDSPLRTCSLTPGLQQIIQPATARYVRRVGRPRKEWVPTIMGEALRLTGGMQQMLQQTAQAAVWKTIIRRG